MRIPAKQCIDIDGISKVSYEHWFCHCSYTTSFFLSFSTWLWDTILVTMAEIKSMCLQVVYLEGSFFSYYLLNFFLGRIIKMDFERIHFWCTQKTLYKNHDNLWNHAYVNISKYGYFFLDTSKTKSRRELDNNVQQWQQSLYNGSSIVFLPMIVRITRPLETISSDRTFRNVEKSLWNWFK